MTESARTEFNPENALVYRRVFAIDQGRVVVEEKWDKTHPHCPFIENPWNPYAGSLNEWTGVRQVVMTAEEYSAAKVPLKQNSVHEPSQLEIPHSANLVWTHDSNLPPPTTYIRR